MEEIGIKQIVKAICDMETIGCRSLNKVDLARELLDIVNVPKEAEIQEIPIDWDNRVEILFLISGDTNYYSVFAGIDDIGNLEYSLYIVGELKEDKYFDFYDDEVVLRKDYFLNYKK